MTNPFNHFKDKKILITGGAGFIGSNLAERIVRLGGKVTIIDCLKSDYGGNLFNLSNIKENIDFHIADVRDTKIMKKLILGQDYLFNLAGQTSHMDSMEDPFTDLEINSRAQLAILEACRHYNPQIKIIFASTRQIYGKPDYLPVDERHLLRPVDVNGINKVSGEQYHILYNNVYGIRSCALRLTNTYGPRMRIKDARQTFVGVWIRSVIQNMPFEVWGGDQLRDFNYIEDVVDALLLAAEDDRSNGKYFNLGGQPVINLKSLADSLCEITGGQYVVKVFPDDRKRIDIGDYYADFSLIQSTLGWQPKTSLKEGLISTINFYKKFLKYYL